MNTFEVSAITFVVGIVAGALLEWKYGSKVAATVTADTTALSADVAALKVKAAADAAALAAKV